MVWTINYSEVALKQLKKMDKTIVKKIDDYLNKKIAPLKNIRQLGKPLLDNKKGLWRYRVSDFRIICKIHDSELIVLVLRMGHRKEIYDE